MISETEKEAAVMINRLKEGYVLSVITNGRHRYVNVSDKNDLDCGWTVVDSVYWHLIHNHKNNLKRFKRVVNYQYKSEFFGILEVFGWIDDNLIQPYTTSPKEGQTQGRVIEEHFLPIQSVLPPATWRRYEAEIRQFVGKNEEWAQWLNKCLSTGMDLSNSFAFIRAADETIHRERTGDSCPSIIDLLMFQSLLDHFRFIPDIAKVKNVSA